MKEFRSEQFCVTQRMDTIIPLIIRSILKEMELNSKKAYRTPILNRFVKMLVDLITLFCQVSNVRE